MVLSVLSIFQVPEVCITILESVTEQFQKLDLTQRVALVQKTIPEQLEELPRGTIDVQAMIRFNSVVFIREHQIFPETVLEEKKLSFTDIARLLKEYHGIDSSDLDFGLSEELFWRRVLAKVNDVNLVKVFQRLQQDFEVPKLQQKEEIRRWFFERRYSFGNLKKLDLSRATLTYLPKELQYCVSLRALNLSNNGLFSLPDWLSAQEKLKALDLFANAFTTIPDSVCKLKGLILLDMASNVMTDIPESISELESLKVLNLSSNRLSKLPDTISKLENLKYLALMNNQLKEFPMVICTLENLRILNLSSNYIKELPGEFEKLEILKTLDLSYNPLVKINFALMKLECLTCLALEGTPLSCVPIPTSEKLQKSGVDVIRFTGRL